MENTPKLTPLMQQYWEIKNQHLDKILLFRMGDFYEMFHDDAVRAAPVLNIALTSRNKNQAESIPMCGVPHHSVGPQINKLLKKGLKVAICDQLESPSIDGKIVKRGVTRVVTPGLVYDPEQLESLSHNYVLGLISRAKNLYDLSSIDASTGEIKTSKGISGAQVLLWIQKLLPKEIILPENQTLFFDSQVLVTKRPYDGKISIEEFVTNYVRETQGEEVLFTLSEAVSLETKSLKLSPTTLRHLEIFKTYDQSEEGSLFSAINLTQTPMGARLLKTRLMSPFSDVEKISKEHKLIDIFLHDSEKFNEVKKLLNAMGDLDRKIVKLSNPLCNARDVRALALALNEAAQLMKKAPEFFENTVASTEVLELSENVLKVLKEELPHSTREGDLINPGINSTLDEYVDLDTNAQTKLSELEVKERNASGIQSLKIKYNNIFGYSFEITKANLDKIPKHFVRRQTLANAERFITDELNQLEQKILASQSKRHELEFEIFNSERKKLLNKALLLLQVSRQISHLDLIQSFARLAQERGYVKPQFIGDSIYLKNSKHPVLENRAKFIANTIELQKGQCLLLTGPNMSGKSTLMRQVALTSILAQTGCFVAADEGRLPLIDQIFTRIGASDNLSEGLSTFMVEMTETAQIIKEATANSLIILDEIGRGTSTYDGLSLAQGVLEHFVDSVCGYTLFATHYHELTELAQTKPAILNAHMSIEEHKGELIFLRRLVKGPASRSYGIEVARLAGLPLSITSRASKILKTLMDRSQSIHSRQMNLLEQEPQQDYNADKYKTAFENIYMSLSQIDLNKTTPLEALNTLSQLKLSADKESMN